MPEWMELERWLGMPLEASAHAAEVDYLMGLVHWLMIVLFLFWAPYFIYTLIRFRHSKHPRANYHGTKSRFSTYLEGGVVLAEVGLLFGFAIPIWGELRDETPPEAEAVLVEVVGEQFAWNVHYPGEDRIFGRRDPELIDAMTNPLGLDRTDLYAQDDLVTMGELHLPVNRPVLVRLTSKDVIHSFFLPELRVKQDAIPGLSIPVWFVPTRTGDYEIACAQLCGVGHYRMRGYVTIHEPEEYEAWLQAAREDQPM